MSTNSTDDAVPHGRLVWRFDHEDSTQSSEAGYAEVAAEAIRAYNHLTLNRRDIPAPEAFTILGCLKQLAYRLDQALQQTAEGLRHSIEVGSSRVDLQACKLEYSIVSPK